MTAPSPADLLAVSAQTWPAAATARLGPVTIRDGQGGGKRVSAATVAGDASDELIDAAEEEMRELGQPPLFMIRPGEAALDTQLARRGYAELDPTVIYLCEIARLTDRPLPRVTALTVWEPLQIMREIWTEAGTGPARQAVMDRADCPKTGILGRWNDSPAGAAYVGLHGGVAMVHAVEVLPHQRRQGVAGWMMRAAALWAAPQGATHVAALVTRDNAAGNALYAALGMTPAGGYHYRILTGKEAA